MHTRCSSATPVIGLLALLACASASAAAEKYSFVGKIAQPLELDTTAPTLVDFHLELVVDHTIADETVVTDVDTPLLREKLMRSTGAVTAASFTLGALHFDLLRPLVPQESFIQTRRTATPVVSSPERQSFRIQLHDRSVFPDASVPVDVIGPDDRLFSSVTVVPQTPIVVAGRQWIQSDLQLTALRLGDQFMAPSLGLRVLDDDLHIVAPTPDPDVLFVPGNNPFEAVWGFKPLMTLDITYASTVQLDGLVASSAVSRTGMVAGYTVTAVTAVPEPSRWVLWLLGLVGLGTWRASQQRHKATGCLARARLAHAVVEPPAFRS